MNTNNRIPHIPHETLKYTSLVFVIIVFFAWCISLIIKSDESGENSLISSLFLKIENPISFFGLEDLETESKINFIMAIIGIAIGIPGFIAFFRNMKIIKNLRHDIIFKYIKNKKYKQRISEDRKYTKIVLSYDESIDLKMEDVFINLSVTENNKSENIDINNNDNHHKPVEEVISKYKRLVIIGNPGSGKTLLCRNLVYKYSQGLIKDKLPIVIELRRINESLNLHDFAINKIYEDIKMPKDYLQVKIANGDFRIIFDGFDEINKNRIDSIKESIREFVENNHKCSYIITCRSTVYNNEFYNISNGEEFKIFKIEDFKQSDKIKYAKAWKKNNSNLDINGLLFCLKERWKINYLADNPLMLSMILYLYAIKGDELPHSRGEFYNMLSNHILAKKENTDDLPNITQKSLAYIAYCMQKSNSLVISKEKIESLIQEYSNNNKKYCHEQFVELKRSGFIYKIDNTNYQFSHRTIQEYFVACYFINYQEEKSVEISSKLLIKKYFDNISGWQEIVKFYVNINSRDMSNFIFELDILDQQIDNDIPKITAPIALQSLADAKNINIDVINKVLNRYFFDIDIKYWSIDISRIIGLVTSAINENDPRNKTGKRTFKLLTQQLLSIKKSNNNEQFDAYKNICLALAYSYTKEAFDLLYEFYKEDDKIILESLINMGDLLITYLGERAQKGDEKAIHCMIKAFHYNPSLFDKEILLKEFIKLIWIENQIAYIAAWYLSLTDNIVELLKFESTLETNDINYEIDMGEAKIINYMWSPFSEKDQIIYHIMGRLGYLLYHTPNHFEHFYEPDIIIVIPLLIEYNYDANKCDNNTIIRAYWDDDKKALDLLRKKYKLITKKDLPESINSEYFEQIKIYEQNKYDPLFLSKCNLYLRKNIEKKIKTYDQMSYDKCINEWNRIKNENEYNPLKSKIFWALCALFFLFLILTIPVFYNMTKMYEKINSELIMWLIFGTITILFTCIFSYRIKNDKQLYTQYWKIDHIDFSNKNKNIRWFFEIKFKIKKTEIFLLNNILLTIKKEFRLTCILVFIIALSFFFVLSLKIALLLILLFLVIINLTLIIRHKKKNARSIFFEIAQPFLQRGN